MFKRLLMAIKGNRKFGGAEQGPSDFFTKEEAAFVATKLQQAEFKGAEFEMYYKIMQKLKTVVGR